MLIFFSEKFFLKITDYVFLALSCTFFIAYPLQVRSEGCSSNLEISLNHALTIGRTPCTLFGAIMMKSKMGDYRGLLNIFGSQEYDESYEAFLNAQGAFLAFDLAYRGDRVPNAGEKELISSHLALSNLISTYDADRSIADMQIQFLAYASMISVLYDVPLGDKFWGPLSGGGQTEIRLAKYRPICVLRNLAPEVTQKDIYESPDFLSCMNDNKYVN